jgi:hypothetical protein
LHSSLLLNFRFHQTKIRIFYHNQSTIWKRVTQPAKRGKHQGQKTEKPSEEKQKNPERKTEKPRKETEKTTEEKQKTPERKTEKRPERKTEKPPAINYRGYHYIQVVGSAVTD